MGYSLTPTAYIALLPTVWSLLNRRTLSPPVSALAGRVKAPAVSSGAKQVLEAVIDHFQKASAGSAVKRLGLEFIGRVCMVSLFSIEIQGCQLLIRLLDLLVNSCRLRVDTLELYVFDRDHHYWASSGTGCCRYPECFGSSMSLTPSRQR